MEDFDEKEKRDRLHRYNRRLIELYLWIILAIIISGRLFFIALEGASPIEIIANGYNEIVYAFFVMLFPIIFRLIFGEFPLESLRNRTLRGRNRLSNSDEGSAGATRPYVEIEYTGSASIKKTASDNSAVELLAIYAEDSRNLSNRLFTRAGVYLLVGVMVAFFGLAFFYVMTGTVAFSDTTPPLSIAAILAPKFGVLFFIEVVAFFFLRQYRAAMDEFRYYEALKRHREEALAIIRLFQDSGKPMNPMELIKNGALFSRAGVLEKGQTSELLESRKLEKNELDLLEKVIEVVSRSKK